MNPSTNTDSSLKQQNSLVVRIDQDSDENLQALFDSVLNPGDSKRPLQVPFRMRKLPNSFFNPPAAGSKSPSVTHSRANSTDSAFDAGSQSNVNEVSSVSGVPPRFSMTGLQICHSRAHSSPASLQQTYKECGSSMKNSLEGDVANKASINSAVNKLRQSENITENLQPVHMKQRSYDVVSPIQLQNELGVLPSGWEQAKTNDGQIYYLNHTTKTTQWEDPRIQFRHQAVQQALQQSGNLRILNKESDTVSDPLGPLPQGWEQAFTESGDIYFINHIDRTTSWNDPRIPEINWIHVPHLEKGRQVFKHGQQQAQPNDSLPLEPFLSSDNHSRQESGDSGLSMPSNNFSLNAEFIPHIDDSLDCINENANIDSLSGLDCPDNLVSSLQLEDNICNEMLNNVHTLIDSAVPKLDNLEWYKIN